MKNGEAGHAAEEANAAKADDRHERVRELAETNDDSCRRPDDETL
jgi:hypothetical protein